MSGGPGLAHHIRRALAYPLPRGVGYAQIFGGLLLASFAIQVVTGALLALYYSPSATDAWESVRYIEEEVASGSLIRGVHHFGSSSFVVLLVLHVLRTFIWGAYKGTRKATWVVGCVLFGCVLAFGFTGYLLPWDLKAFFGTRVGVGIAGSAPVVGRPLASLLAGGPAVGELTLPRFYALHAVILPLVTAGLIALHVVLLRVHGVTPHWKHGYLASGRTFHPHQTAKDAAAGLLLVLVLLGLAHWVGAPLEDKADPQNTSYVPRPEWYFLGAQQLLRIFQGDFEILGSFVLPAIGAAIFFLLPWLDRNPERNPRRRPVAMSAGAAALVGVAGLTLWGNAELKAEEVAMAGRVEAREAQSAAAEPAAEPEEEEEAPDEAELVRRGEILYRDLACGACHGETHLVEDTPSLAFEGDVVHRDWLREYLAKPTPIRFGPGGRPPATRMPDFLLAEDELDALVAYLVGRTEGERFAAPELDPATAEAELEQGRVLFDELDCLGCHVLGDEGEDFGPRLDGVARRLKAGYMYRLVIDPEGVIPGTPMTDYYLEDEEARAILRYLLTLR
ncbi:MAG: cytochrome b N-terminal domain-containing protein [Planctomycetota bacterium]